MDVPQALSPQPQMGRRFPNQPLVTPHQDGWVQCQFHMDLWNLEDAPLRQLMEDLQQEVGHRELNAPHRGPTLGCWRTLAGDRDTSVDDEEVTFLEGRGWEPRGQPPQPAGPPQPEKDVGHLNSTLATGL